MLSHPLRLEAGISPLNRDPVLQPPPSGNDNDANRFLIQRSFNGKGLRTKRQDRRREELRDQSHRGDTISRSYGFPPLGFIHEIPLSSPASVRDVHPAFPFCSRPIHGRVKSNSLCDGRLHATHSPEKSGSLPNGYSFASPKDRVYSF